MQKTSRFSRLLTLVTAVALAVCLPVSAYAETETTEEAAAPAVVEEATQDNTADEAASEDSASCVRVVDVTMFWAPMLLNWAPAALVHSRLAAW